MKALTSFLCALIAQAMIFTGSFVHGEELKVLFLGDNGHHQPSARFRELEPVLRGRGIDMTYTDDMSQLSTESLARYDALVLYANIDAIAPDQAAALMQYVRGGGGYVPLHCATFCFRNAPEMVALMGAQFQRHGTGVFRAEIADGSHELMKGYGGFQSWDETYVHHRHNDANRTVLEYRVDSEGREPWTWIRNEGDGRVFYTAWGHDSRTWTNPGFQNLVERGILWASKRDPQAAGTYLADQPFPVPAMTEIAADATAFDYIDVGGQIPNYTPSAQWGVQGKPLNLMQKPLPPQASQQHLVVPQGFHVELFVSEPELTGKPICMAWDERGRLWVAETMDYPNELQPPGTGRDQIRICEDTDQDGKADKFTVFADKLSIPTSIAFSRGGAIVQNAVETLYLKDNDGDDRADERRVLVSGWNLGDTHGGVSNFQYGLDNWLWAMQGYNNSEPVAGDSRQRFRMGFFRMRPDGSEVEFIRSTNNNTWGLGISEEGLIFGSTANGCPSVFMPIANRYYERVRGWTPSLTLSSIADTNEFHPITDKVRQVDQHGGYTAGAGHAIYTAREYPQEYWNRVAFVNGPTGHLVGAFVLRGEGSGFQSSSPFNLLASDDEWTAPIMAEVGPDGTVWVIDWYNYIVQHNPTPEGFRTGKGQAYETELRDKKHGRIYRVVPDGSRGAAVPALSLDNADGLIAALSHPTMLVRKHAQRLLVERGQADVADRLVALVQDRQIDEVGLNVAAIHALWTLHGLGLIDTDGGTVFDAVVAALGHPSPGVRRNAVQVLPASAKSVNALLASDLVADRDSQVRLAALLALSDLPSDSQAAAELVGEIGNAASLADRWSRDALTSAAANNSSEFLAALAGVDQPSEQAIQIIAIVSEHHARGADNSDGAKVLAALHDADPQVLEAVIQGFSRGWKPEQKVQLDEAIERDLEKIIDRVPPGTRGSVVRLATRWGSKRFSQYGEQIAKGLLEIAKDSNKSDPERGAAAEQLIDFLQDDGDAVADLLDLLTPQTPPQVAASIVNALETSRWDGVGAELVGRLDTMTPGLKKVAFTQLLKRPTSTAALLDAAETGKVSLDELALDQKQSLASHPDRQIRRRAEQLFEKGGSLPSADRQQVLDAYAVSTEQVGDAEKGVEVFKLHCSKCHIHGQMGVAIGPNLTGMAVHPKKELLTHILDPSRSVEGNFRAYTLLSVDGIVLTGMLASESKTAVELVDTEGKKQSVLRDDIEQLKMSTKSIMPEGFEKSITPEAMSDLLEFLTKRGQFVPVPLDRYATAVSTKGLFSDNDLGPDRLVFSDWGPKTFKEIPFLLTDPQGKSKPNIIMLYGPNAALPPKMPRSVSLPCNSPATAIHFLSGVGGWSFPYDRNQSVSVVVRLHYADGQTEDHEWVNGVHFADYIRRVDVPESEFAFQLGGQQLRYLAVVPKRQETIATIELRKGRDQTAPIVMAVTVESPSAAH